MLCISLVLEQLFLHVSPILLEHARVLTHRHKRGLTTPQIRRKHRTTFLFSIQHASWDIRRSASFRVIFEPRFRKLMLLLWLLLNMLWSLRVQVSSSTVIVIPSHKSPSVDDTTNILQLITPFRIERRRWSRHLEMLRIRKCTCACIRNTCNIRIRPRVVRRLPIDFPIILENRMRILRMIHILILIRCCIKVESLRREMLLLMVI